MHTKHGEVFPLSMVRAMMGMPVSLQDEIADSMEINNSIAIEAAMVAVKRLDNGQLFRCSLTCPEWNEVETWNVVAQICIFGKFVCVQW